MTAFYFEAGSFLNKCVRVANYSGGRRKKGVEHRESFKDVTEASGKTGQSKNRQLAGQEPTVGPKMSRKPSGRSAKALNFSSAQLEFEA